MLAAWLCLSFSGAILAQASLSGTIVNDVTGGSASDSPATASREPAEGEQRTGVAIRLLRGAENGPECNFDLNGIAPGEYRLYAFEEIDDRTWLDPNYMVKLAEKETRTISLRMIAGGQ